MRSLLLRMKEDMKEKSVGAPRLFPSGNIPEKIWNISFFLLMLAVICFGNIQTGTNYYYYGVFFLFIGVTFSEILMRKNWYKHIFLPLQTIWYGLFLILALLSSVWASSFDTTMLPLSRMVQILVLTNCLIQHVDSDGRLERYIRIVLAASLFLAIYLLARTPITEWFDGFLGRGTGYNSNDIGLSLAMGVIFSFYLAYIRKQKKYFIVTAFSFFTVILTSSRKAIFMSTFGVLILVVFHFRARKYMLRVLSVLAGLILAIVLIFQVPQLHQVLGVRLETMVEYFMSDHDADYSISLRNAYVGIAKSILREHPILGIGLNNFSYYVRSYGNTLSYCHNNYWELAADLGIVGLVVYYWFYAYLLFKLVRQMFDGCKSALLFMTLLLQFLVFEYGIVNYYKIQSHLVLAAAYCAVILNDQHLRKEEEAS